LSTRVNPEPIPARARDTNSLDDAAGGFPESQQAGLAALSSLATTAPIPALPSAALVPVRLPARRTQAVREQKANPKAVGTQLPSPASPSAAGHRRLEASPRASSRGHAQSRGFVGLIASHGIRIGTFSVIGAVVFVLGTAFQWLLVTEGVGATASYTWQAVFSIELSFALNRWLTWRDRKVRLLPALTKWNLQKIALTVPNIAGYAVLVHKGMNWLVANLLMTAVFTVINYVGGDLWSFASRRRAAHAARKRRHVSVTGQTATNVPRESSVPSMSRMRHPTVSAIIPCKNNAATIRATVDALLGQYYPALIEVILVGDVGDPSWTALEGITDPRLVILEQEATPGKRDPNVKRDKGIHKSSGEILALVDSDIVMDPGWLSTAIEMLNAQGGGLVAGGMRSIHDTFWGRFIDRNTLAAKTPRLPRPYPVTAENFGRYGYKPPITANAVFTRELYDACPLDTAWAYGYEDYEWFWRLAKAGHQILFSGDLTAAHHHRRSFRRLAREYRQSASGCARFIRVHGDSPLARKRRLQAVLLPLAALSAVVLAATAAVAGYGAVLGVVALATLAALMVREVAQSRSLEAVTYPAASLALGVVFTVRLAATLGQQVIRGDDMHSVRELQANTPRTRTESDVSRFSWPLVAILTLQAGLSLSLVWSNTAFGDEALYLTQGRLELASWLHGVSIPAFKLPDSGAPQIYPVIGALANAVGGLAAARILSLCFMLIATVLIYLIALRLFDKNTALVGSALFAVSESVLRLAFATFDAMACLLIILAAWLIVQTGIRSRRGELILLSAVSLTLGNITAFSFAIFDPIVVVVAFLIWQIRFGTRTAFRYAAWLTAITIMFTSLLMTILHLWNAAFLTTASRDSGLGQGISLVLRSAWSFDGLLVVIAFAGVIIAFAERDQRRFLLLVLALAGIIVPAYQAHIGTAFSMDKHMSAGNGFAAIAAGYAFSRVSLPYARRHAAGFLAVAAIAFSAVTGVWYARSTFHTWANTGPLLTDLRGLSANNTKPVLINSLNGNFNVWIFEYYLMNGYDWEHWKDNSPSSIPNVDAGYYSAVVVNLNASLLDYPGLPEKALQGKNLLSSEILRLAGNDNLINALTESHKYKISTVVPYFTSNNANSSGLFVIWQHVKT
jgi:GT2 family glycosyltransferase